MSMIGELCTDGWERNLPRTGRQVAEALAAQREAEWDWGFARVKSGDELVGCTAVSRAAYQVRVNALRASGEAGGQEYQLALTWARTMAAHIADGAERCMVERVIELHQQCRPVVSWSAMTLPMRTAWLALEGRTRPWEPAQ